MLLHAAAQRWQVDVSDCRARASHIEHLASNRVASFGELAAAAVSIEPPERPPLKPRSAYSIVGKPQARFDIPAKVDGTATFGIDVSVPEMLYATVSAAPVFGATLEAVDTSAAETMIGVRRIVRLPNAVAVVADSYWRALKALRALKPQFSRSPHAAVDTSRLFETIGQTLTKASGRSLYSAGDVERAGSADQLIEVEYRAPFVAHATLEPMNATARVTAQDCEIWTGVQDPLAARKVAAEAAGLDIERVTVHNQSLGGGFGRRLPGNHDFIEQAVRIAKELAPTPVKLIWSREEDMQHDFYRPAVLARFRGGLDATGRPTVWSSRCNGIDATSAVAAACPYAIANVDVRAFEDTHHVRVGAWRSVAHSEHGFFTESFIDELAHAAQRDPLEFRLSLLSDKPRHRGVLSRAAELAGWDSPLTEGRGRGVAVVECFGSIVAEVAEVSVHENLIKVERVVAVVDCGEVINPDTAAAQIEGGIVFGLSAALFDEITIRNGRVEQANFGDYRLPKLADAPRITVEFLSSDAPIGGLGEPGVPPIAPAVANAVFAATGQRLRTLPLRLR